MPPPAPLAMPSQNLRYAVPAQQRLQIDYSVLFARFLIFSGTLGITAYGAYEMLDAVRFAEMTVLQGMMIFFFALTLSWIGFSASAAVAGLFKWPEPRVREDLNLDGIRTALVMPVYNEDPTSVSAALQAMAEALVNSGASQLFEIVILSDSTHADSWVRESLALDRLRRAVPNISIWYRRRWQNTARKSGNVEDFVTHWGARYQYMIVLDADSLIDASTLIALVRKMHADPALGILQTAPALINAHTLFGRVQQFSACVYGPVIARGLAAWSGDSGNYWGHNAIIRINAFAQNCGLPLLPGRKPLGGHVLSHDFVEAALIRRAKWKVRLATDLAGSYEECPPTLTDLAVRDRRWAQGNLQHSKIIGAAGLAAANRLHMAIGIMSYVSSPIWLVMLCIGFALSLQSHLIRPEYFTRDFQLFPTWPRFDARLMLDLFIFSMAVLLVPKAIGLLRAIVHHSIRRATFGIVGLVASAAIELIMSALYAPILMLTQSSHVFAVLLGRDSGWGAQRRKISDSTIVDAWIAYRKMTLIGIGTAVIAWFLSPSLLAWLAPALLGLLLSVPLSRLSGSVSIARALRKVGLLRTPEEAHEPALVARKRELINEAESLPEDGLFHLSRHREARAAHIEAILPKPAGPRGQPDANFLTAGKKIEDAAHVDEALEWLTPPERICVAGSPALLNQLGALPELPKRPRI